MTEITDKEGIARVFRTAYQARKCTYNALSGTERIELVDTLDVLLLWSTPGSGHSRAVMFRSYPGMYVIMYSTGTESVRVEPLTPDFEH